MYSKRIFIFNDLGQGACIFKIYGALTYILKRYPASGAAVALSKVESPPGLGQLRRRARPVAARFSTGSIVMGVSSGELVVLPFTNPEEG
jgi:hypothetical protein